MEKIMEKVKNYFWYIASVEIRWQPRESLEKWPKGVPFNYIVLYKWYNLKKGKPLFGSKISIKRLEKLLKKNGIHNLGVVDVAWITRRKSMPKGQPTKITTLKRTTVVVHAKDAWEPFLKELERYVNRIAYWGKKPKIN